MQLLLLGQECLSPAVIVAERLCCGWGAWEQALLF